MNRNFQVFRRLLSRNIGVGHTYLALVAMFTFVAVAGQAQTYDWGINIGNTGEDRSYAAL